MNDRRDRVIYLRMSAEERAIIRRAASLCGARTLSGWIVAEMVRRAAASLRVEPPGRLQRLPGRPRARGQGDE
jgi:uncharacterized protein (DUF1778 family)